MPTRVVMIATDRPASAGRFAMGARGFTLPELVMVIVVLGILAIVVIPAFSGGDDYKARGFSDELLSAARYAQKLAIASACPVTMSITGNTYTLKQLDGCNSGSPFTVRHPARAEDYAGDATRAATTLTGPASIVFFADGSSSGGALTTGGRTFTVIASTGYVQE